MNRNTFSGDVEADRYDKSENSEPEPSFGKSIPEITKMKRQKKYDAENQKGEHQIKFLVYYQYFSTIKSRKQFRKT